MVAKGDDPGSKDVVRMWTIYCGATDSPRRYAVRGFTIRRGELFAVPDEKGYAVDTLAAARSLLPPGLYNLGRDPRDEPQVVETWI
jgi:hypothetical protein